MYKNTQKIEINNFIAKIYNNNIAMEYSKMSKIELLQKCKEKGMKKYKTKNKMELIELLETTKLNENIESQTTMNEKKEMEIIQYLETNKIYNEDCIIGMKKIKNETVDVIICDPPYNIGKDFGNDSDKQKMDEYLSWCDNWIHECLRILKPNGTLFIYGFSEILAFIRTRINCNVRWLVWHYTNKVTPTLNFWQRTHESILCCYKNKPVFNCDDVREPYTETYLHLCTFNPFVTTTHFCVLNNKYFITVNANKMLICVTFS